MLEKEKFYKKIIFFVKFFLIYFFFTNISYSDIKENIIKKISETSTLSFTFKQRIAEKEEIGNCIIKYPLMMKCDYQNKKQKSIISNGKTVAIIKKKYKKIYLYPLKITPLFIILEKNKILNLIKNNKLIKNYTKFYEFEYIEKNGNMLKILFDKSSLDIKGWTTKDSYSNDVTFLIDNLIFNETIEDSVFKIPKENDL
jgi:outer membrane lipoprotein-sorting protein